MSSHHKKKSEGIALLSIYGDDEDDEMQDFQEEDEDEELPNQEQDLPVNDTVFEHSSSVIMEEHSRIVVSESPGNKNTPPFIYQEQQNVSIENFTAARVVNLGVSSSATTTLQHSLTSPPERKRQRARLAIVDYGHDELAMSPEAEEGEITASYAYGEELHTISGDLNQATPPQQFEPNNQVDAANGADIESRSVKPDEAVMVPAENPIDTDPLSLFLPPPPMDRCSDELQRKIVKFLELKKSGRIYNAEVRNRKEYRNPDFLLHAVTYQDIDQIGSCFHRDVYDPHGYDRTDFYDEIEADMRREMHRKEEERKRSPKVDFTSGGTQPGTIVPSPKINMLLPGITNVAGAGLTTTSAAAADALARDGRQNKKSKWDKVDGDRKNILPPGQDSVSAIASHAALLTAANAGTGYSAFAQQRRREAEDKRSSDKRTERRS